MHYSVEFREDRIPRMVKPGGVVFLTELKRRFEPGAERSSGRADSISTPLATAPCENGSSACLESLSKDSRRAREVESAVVDLVRYQPLPGSVNLSTITDRVGGYSLQFGYVYGSTACKRLAPDRSSCCVEDGLLRLSIAISRLVRNAIVIRWIRGMGSAWGGTRR